jgi:hypothetical protein
MNPTAPGPEVLAATADPDERYLALLAWAARHHACDFADFVSHRPSAGRHLGLDRAQLRALRDRNRARQVGASPFWAVMTLDAAARRAFVHDLLEFVGCPDDAVAAAVAALGTEPDDAPLFRRAG